eukprot:1161643-Pelagomonas_calceolata.AAC.15
MHEVVVMQAGHENTRTHAQTTGALHHAPLQGRTGALQCAPLQANPASTPLKGCSASCTLARQDRRFAVLTLTKAPLRDWTGALQRSPLQADSASKPLQERTGALQRSPLQAVPASLPLQGCPTMRTLARQDRCSAMLALARQDRCFAICTLARAPLLVDVRAHAGSMKILMDGGAHAGILMTSQSCRACSPAAYFTASQLKQPRSPQISLTTHFCSPVHRCHARSACGAPAGCAPLSGRPGTGGEGGQTRLQGGSTQALVALRRGRPHAPAGWVHISTVALKCLTDLINEQAVGAATCTCRVSAHEEVGMVACCMSMVRLTQRGIPGINQAARAAKCACRVV